MRKHILIIVFLLLTISSVSPISAQNVVVTDDESYTEADPSAVLDVYSTERGMLIPRMTTSDRLSISNPKAGLLVYDTDAQGFFLYGNTVWKNLSVSAETWTNDAPNTYLSNMGNNVGIGTVSPSGKLVIQADELKAPDDPLLEVKDKDGVTIFSVTSEGARLYVKDYDAQKGISGGFAVGKYSVAKEQGDTVFLMVTADSTRVYTKPSGNNGGFAVGEYSSNIPTKFFTTGPDSTAIYIKESDKGVGGFAVGKYSTAKESTDYFNIKGSTTPDIIEDAAGMFWYPLKEAFLVGRIQVLSPDEVGLNAFSTGYHSKATGNYSQAMGFQNISFGNYSGSIGKNSRAYGLNSFAFGDSAQAYGDYSYAMGNAVKAEGRGSFAFGVLERFDPQPPGDTTIAVGDYSIAIGVGARAEDRTSISIGVNTISGGQGSSAIGYATTASGSGSSAIGQYAEATNLGAVSLGGWSVASGKYSFAAGQYNEAGGDYSASLGCLNIASGNFSTAIGYKADTNGKSGSFVIGASAGSDVYPVPVLASEDNQFTVRAIGGYQFFADLNMNTENSIFISPTDGNLGIGVQNPARKLHINDVMRLEPRATEPDNPQKGDMYYSSVHNTLMLYTGIVGGWKKVMLE